MDHLQNQIDDLNEFLQEFQNIIDGVLILGEPPGGPGFSTFGIQHPRITLSAHRSYHHDLCHHLKQLADCAHTFPDDEITRTMEHMERVAQEGRDTMEIRTAIVQLINLIAAKRDTVLTLQNPTQKSLALHQLKVYLHLACTKLTITMLLKLK